MKAATAERIGLLDLSHAELRQRLQLLGLPAYMADQVFQWRYFKNVADSSRWTNISRKNRTLLGQAFTWQTDAVVAVAGNSEGTRKFLIELSDGLRIEAVLIPEKKHITLCISSQVGCALGCTFCATGNMGFRRNLTPGEIVSQVLILKAAAGADLNRLNLVWMGMGEPLLNYDNLKKALGIILHPSGLAISPRRITVSTAGILEKIKNLESDFPQVKIAFSLNASSADQRQSLMPVAGREALAEILAYFRKQRRRHRITFEYVLLDGVNDTPADARRLAGLIRGIPAKINLIPYNPVPRSAFETPSPERVEAFQRLLLERGFTVNVRWSKGRDIRSACGQLATAAAPRH